MNRLQFIGGTPDRPDNVYYNADIINNTTTDSVNGIVTQDPYVRFNETREAPILKNAEDYHFSIVRFTMDGAEKDLPLFIPQIVQGTGQTNINTTVYTMAVSLQSLVNIPVNYPAFDAAVAYPAGEGVFYLGLNYTAVGGFPAGTLPTAAEGWIQTYLGNYVATPLTIAPPQRAIQYVPENQNPTLAPLPKSMAAPGYRGLYGATASYALGDIVAAAIDIQTGSGAAPFYIVQPPDYVQTTPYFAVGTVVAYNSAMYSLIAPYPNNYPFQNGLTPVYITPLDTTYWSPTLITGQSPSVASPAIWQSYSAAGGNTQDLTSRYYWVNTYTHWVNLWNKTMYDPLSPEVNQPYTAVFTSCMGDLYALYGQAWSAVPNVLAGSFSLLYPTLADFVSFVAPPQLSYSPTTKLFTILGDVDGFGNTPGAQEYNPVPAWNAGITYTYVGLVGDPTVPNLLQTASVSYGGATWSLIAPAAAGAVPGVSASWALGFAGPITNGNYRLFWNTNMAGLFANFPMTYWNTQDPLYSPFLLRAGSLAANKAFPPVPTPYQTTPAIITPPTTGNQTPYGYAYEVLFPNDLYQNILALNTNTTPYVDPPYNKVYWVTTQNYQSTGSLWSPISALVFTSQLLPLNAEFTGAPVILGSGNLGYSSQTTQNAFTRIITDIAIDTSTSGAEAYRQFVYYSPVAEYRLSDFSTSKNTQIQNVDVQVFFKNRLDNQLYPVQLYNLGNVSIKILFRHKDAAGKSLV
jgi:hypothetical protein